MNAITEKGVSITSSDTFRSYADKIKGITSGGGGGILCNINYGGYTTVIDNVKNNISATVLTVDNLTPNIVGSPTNDNGILSNFTNSDYVKVDNYSGYGASGKHVYKKLRRDGSFWSNSVETIISNEGVFAIEAYRNNTLTTYNWTTGTTYPILNNIEQDKWYYAVIKISDMSEGNPYNVKYYFSTVSYEDALSNGFVETIEQTAGPSSDYTFKLHYGRHCALSDRYAANIAIDFNETYIKNPDGSYYLQFRQEEKLI